MEEHIVLEITESVPPSNIKPVSSQNISSVAKLPEVITSGINPIPIQESGPIHTSRTQGKYKLLKPLVPDNPKQLAIKNISYNNLPNIQSKKQFAITNMGLRRKTVMQMGGLR